MTVLQSTRLTCSLITFLLLKPALSLVGGKPHLSDSGTAEEPPASLTSNPTLTGVQADISYHSGEINVGVTSIYNVFYGDWSGALPHSDSVAVDIFNTFSANIGATPWYNILTTYWETGGSTPTSAVFDGYYFINSTSYPTSLSTNDIIDVLSIAAYQGAIPVSPGSSDNVYLFIVSEGNVPLRFNR